MTPARADAVIQRTRRAQDAASRSGVTPRSSRCSRRPASRCPSWPAFRYDPGDPRRSDIDLWQREITVRGKGGKPRIVKIGHQAARSLDRYLRARTRHAQAWRPQLWLGINNREPPTSAGIYQMIARRGRQCGVAVHPHRFRHHFSHTWLDRGGPDVATSWNSTAGPPRRCSAGTAPAPARPAIRGRRSGDGDPGQRLPDQPGHLPRRRHPPQVDTGRSPSQRPVRPGWGSRR